MTKIPSQPPPGNRAAPPMAMAPAGARAVLLRRAHRLSAVVLVAYALPHLVNHLLAVGGAGAIARHMAFMGVLRQVVRVPAVEALLLACVAFQVGSGVAMLIRRRRARRARLPLPLPPLSLRQRAQALSGAYLAFFLTVHVGAVLGARWLLGLDTNFHFAAAGLRIAPFPLFFVPYYALAIVALAVHLGCVPGLWLGRERMAVIVAGIGGAVLAAAILAAFSGLLYPVTIPAAYANSLRLLAP